MNFVDWPIIIDQYYCNGEHNCINQHFSNAGFPCPIMRSPSDHFLRAINTEFDIIIAMCKNWQDDNGDFSSVNMDTAVAICRVEATYKSSNDAAAVESLIQKLMDKEGKDVVSCAKTGYGKTYAYLLSLLHKLYLEDCSNKTSPTAFVLVPTRELCQQIYSEALSLLELCRVQLKLVQLTSDMLVNDMTDALARPFDAFVLIVSYDGVSTSRVHTGDADIGKWP